VAVGQPSGFIDISVPIRTGMPIYPGDPGFAISRISDLASGDHATVSEVCMGLHTGTHIDAPAHFIDGAAGIAAMPFDATIGPVRVLSIAAEQAVTAEDLFACDIHAGERILLKTRNSALWADNDFHEDFVYLTTEAAAYLASLPVRCVGIDYLSVGGFHFNGTEVHRTLLGAGVWLIEGVDLARVEPGEYELICLPLWFAEGEASPARALLRTLG
jgi:arylformamidase